MLSELRMKCLLFTCVSEKMLIVPGKNTTHTVKLMLDIYAVLNLFSNRVTFPFYYMASQYRK